MKIARVPLASITLLLFVSTAGAVQTYRLTDLGTLGGDTSIGAAINASGEAAGIAFVDALATRRAFRYSGGTMQDLGTLGGTESFGTAINASGAVVGDSYLAGDQRLQAFYAGTGPIRPLGTLGGIGSTAYGINAAGRVVGGSDLRGDAEGHAFLSAPDGGALQDIGTPGVQSTAEAVNDADQIAGTFFPTSGGFHAFLWQNGVTTDLGTLGGNSRGRAINASGVVAGFSDYGTGSSFAVLFSGGKVQNLGAIPGDTGSQAIALNAFGVVVGESFTDGFIPIPRAFVYADGTMRDLTSLLDASGTGWSLTSATGVNDAGQIVGTGSIGGQVHAFVLTPVPEPASLVADLHMAA